MYEKVKELVDFAFHSGVTNVLVVFPGFDLLYLTEKFGFVDMFETDLNGVVKINVLILDKIKANKQFFNILLPEVLLFVNPSVQILRNDL